MKFVLGALLFVGLVSCGENQNGAVIPGRAEASLDAVDLTSGPARCQQPMYAKDPACFASNPEYCKSSNFSAQPSCVASQPEYCASANFSKEPACFSANPSYCQDPAYAEDLACVYSARVDRLSLYCRGFDHLKLCPPPNG